MIETHLALQRSLSRLIPNNINDDSASFDDNHTPVTGLDSGMERYAAQSKKVKCREHYRYDSAPFFMAANLSYFELGHFG